MSQCSVGANNYNQISDSMKTFITVQATPQELFFTEYALCETNSVVGCLNFVFYPMLSRFSVTHGWAWGNGERHSCAM